MLVSVTLWRSQLGLWSVETSPDEAYLRHEPCRTEMVIVTGGGSGTYSLLLDGIVDRIAGHRCPTLTPTTPQLVDGPG